MVIITNIIIILPLCFFDPTFIAAEESIHFY